MGKQTFDQYTYLHFAVGVVTYYWGFKLRDVFLMHTIFELFENTPFGMSIINNHLTIWPGGKPQPDSMLNIIGDTLGFLVGWISAYYLDIIGSKYNWYFKHIE